MTNQPSSTALGHFRVLDLSNEWGAYGAKMLADMGADVIKVEPPGGCPTRQRGPFVGDDPHPDKSLFFLYHNANKRGITLNLEVADGQALFRGLVEVADVVFESFPRGYLPGLGLGYEALSQVNPNLVMTSITPFGQTGPYRDWKGADIVIWAMGGPLWGSGLPDRPPLHAPGQSFIFGAMNAAVATLLALYTRPKLGRGQQADISGHEAVVAIMPESGVPAYLDDRIVRRRDGNRRFGAVGIGLLPCKDGYVAICTVNARQWETHSQWVHEVTGNEDILADTFKGPGAVRAAYRDAIDVWLCEHAAHFTKQAFFEEGQRRHLPVTPVNTAEEVLKDPQLKARGYWQALEHPMAGQLTYPGAPYKFADTPWALRRPAPGLGEHNQEVYRQELGLSAEELASLKSRGVI